MEEHHWSFALGVAAPVLDEGGVVGEVAEVVACVGGGADVFVLGVKGVWC